MSSHQVRWLEFLQTFKLEFVYHPGREAHVPDFLSRIATVVVKPGWLGRVARAQHCAPELNTFLEAARG